MTVGHLLFAAAGTGYVAVGLHFEERDLYRQLGNTYRDYADRVPALVPSPTRPRPFQDQRLGALRCDHARRVR